MDSQCGSSYSVDADKIASSETSCSGPTLFYKMLKSYAHSTFISYLHAG